MLECQAYIRFSDLFEGASGHVECDQEGQAIMLSVRNRDSPSSWNRLADFLLEIMAVRQSIIVEGTQAATNDIMESVTA